MPKWWHCRSLPVPFLAWCITSLLFQSKYSGKKRKFFMCYCPVLKWQCWDCDCRVWWYWLQPSLWPLLERHMVHQSADRHFGCELHWKSLIKVNEVTHLRSHSDNLSFLQPGVKEKKLFTCSIFTSHNKNIEAQIMQENPRGGVLLCNVTMDLYPCGHVHFIINKFFWHLRYRVGVFNENV